EKIGLLSPMTGGLGILGPSFENGATLAIEHLNDMGLGVTFTLVTQDTATSATGAAAGATNLVAAGVKAVVGAAASSATLAAIPILMAAGIPQISYASTSPSITEYQDNGYLFRVVPSDKFQGRAGGLLLHTAGATSVAIAGIDDPYGQGLVGAFVEAYQAIDASYIIATNQAYNQETTTDFTGIVQSLVDASADAIYLVSFLDDGAAIINGLATAGYTGPIFGTDGIASNDIFTIQGITASMEGTVGTAPKVTGTTDFVSQYNTRFGNDPDIFVAEAYDATMIAGKAIVEAGTSATGAEIRDAVTTVGTNYAGASGTISFDTNGDIEGGSYDVWQAQSGTLVTVGGWSEGVLTLDEATLDVTKWPVNPFAAAASSSDDEDGGFLPFSLPAFIIALFAVSTAFRRRRKNN
ncbi:MAG: ABC transporter substrate-binding protein, partial [Candidatus Heimdallarchaeota archaeon]|nr:ABC transporter substrate-binding protein [Candidatus Heimdallarchaeota archaeon]